MINLTQWLCPSRHALFAIPWDDKMSSATLVVEEGESLFTAGLFNRWCGICGSKDIKPEAGQTKFATMEDAQETLRKLEDEQTVARYLIGGKF